MSAPPPPVSRPVEEIEVVLPEQYARQGRLIKSSSYEDLKHMKITVVGAGQIGGQIWNILTRMAEYELLTVIDFDQVETNNVCTQSFNQNEIGMPKVDALAARATSVGNKSRIKAVNSRWTPELTADSDVIFMCVDQMDVRREIFMNAPDKTQFMGDVRAAGRTCQIFAITKENRGREYYPSTLFTNEEAETGGCTVDAFCGTGMLAAAMMMDQFLVHLQGHTPELHIYYNGQPSVHEKAADWQKTNPPQKVTKSTRNNKVKTPG